MNGSAYSRIIELAAERYAVETRVLAAGGRGGDAQLREVHDQLCNLIAALDPPARRYLAALHFLGRYDRAADWPSCQAQADEMLAQRGDSVIDHLASVALHLSLPVAIRRRQ